ncbi:MAG: ABC transporter ATP-binding protein, partial [Candidatus Aenigmarchaeota archaeon]|nr:ABC transporter ATP-binding protein [Candidatus Aenigmarchaeota archaeon]
FIGPSGSGKTTMLNLFGVLDKPTLGTLKVIGTDISKLNYVERAKFRGEHLGFIFQNFNLIPVLTVYENVEYPLVMVKSLPQKERKEKVLSLLDAVGMLDQKDKFINQISGGQKQRAAIARALTTDPKIVLADEPTANLDHASAYKVMSLMKKMSHEAGTTFIFSTHDPKIVKEVDIIYTLEDGVLIKREERSN